MTEPSPADQAFVAQADAPVAAPSEAPPAADNPLTEAPAVESPPAAPETPPEAAEPAAEDAQEPDEQAERIKKLAVEARDARRKTRALEAEIAVLRGQKQEEPDAELERKVAARAEQLAANAVFTAKCNTIFQEGAKAFGAEAFRGQINALNETLGAIPVNLIEAADDAGQPAKLLSFLADNVDITERLVTLSPHRMGVEMARLAAKLTAPPVVKPAKVSKAPPPLATVSGAAGGETDPEKMSISDFMAYEDARVMARRH